MTQASNKSYRKIVTNRKALRDYQVHDRMEAGLELKGTEVKSVREGNVSLVGSFADINGNEAILNNLNIAAYEFGNRFNHDPDRPRRLLLHRGEINKLKVHIEQKGGAIVPLSVYIKKGLVKVELGICKGKKQFDKRETLKRKTADREAERAMKEAR